jgi:hypothetical protein
LLQALLLVLQLEPLQAQELALDLLPRPSLGLNQLRQKLK